MTTNQLVDNILKEWFSDVSRSIASDLKTLTQEREDKMSKNDLNSVIEDVKKSRFTFDADKSYIVPEGRYYDSNYFETEELAVEYAKKQSIHERKLMSVYKIVKTVSFPAPTESSIKVEKVA